MAKRFTNTSKYDSPFVRALKGPYKLLWDYLYHACDHAGIWTVDFDIAQKKLGDDMPVSKELALQYFNEEKVRIIEVDRGRRWFLPSFIEWQYGELKSENRVHNSVLQELKKYEIAYSVDKGFVSPLQGAKDKDKEKDKDKDKEKELTEKKSDPHPLNKFLDTLDNVRRLRDQPTDEQLAKLVSTFGETPVRDIFESMQNKKDLTKKYNSVFLTANNWLKSNHTGSNGTGKKIGLDKKTGSAGRDAYTGANGGNESGGLGSLG